MPFHDRDLDIGFRIQVALGAAGCALCGIFSIPAACITGAAMTLMLLCEVLAHRRCDKRIDALCDEIDRILHEDDSFRLDSFQEGRLSILASEIRKMTIRLREQNAQLAADKRFMKESLEDISHQLRTPLTSMLLIVSLLRNPERTQEQRLASLQELAALLTQMQWLIETLLSLSRLNAGAVHFRLEKIGCRKLLRTAIEPLSISMELKDITPVLEIEGDPSFIGDFAYCAEAIENILKNCMEHTPAGGHITIQAVQNEIFTQILITDSGDGIAEDDLPHLFERFYRSSDFPKNGYGIGLAFAQKTIAAQEGSLQARNAPPHGAQFDLRFYRTTV